MGFDQPKKLGSGETGGRASLPIWIGYMKQALKDVPESTLAQPDGLKSVGKEFFYSEQGPQESSADGIIDPTPPNPRDLPTD